jgi:lipopolysaccharide export system permease protein
VFGLVTFVCGDYLAPLTERLANQLQAAFSGSLKLDRSGAWIKEHAMTPGGERSYSINVGSAEGGSTLHDVRIFEFDANGSLLTRTAAASANVGADEQTAQAPKIQFWRRALYPLACLVMVGLALPFAYLNARSGGVSVKVFMGIMLGVSFVLLNNVFRYLGLLGNWTPWIVAAAPGALYLLLSLAAFSWLVRYR